MPDVSEAVLSETEWQNNELIILLNDLGLTFISTNDRHVIDLCMRKIVHGKNNVENIAYNYLLGVRPIFHVFFCICWNM